MKKYYSKNNRCECGKLITNISKQCSACMGLKRKGENNLVSLCRKCHIKTNFNRKKWTKYFKEIVKWQTKPILLRVI